MLDDKNVIKQRDPSDLLGVIASEWRQIGFDAKIVDETHDGRELTKIIVVGVGSMALSAHLLKSGLYPISQLPFSVVSDYRLPEYVDDTTLVVVCSYTGDTDEALSGLAHAKSKGAQIAVVTGGGKLGSEAARAHMAHVIIPSGVESRTAGILVTKSILVILEHFKVVGEGMVLQFEEASKWVEQESLKWIVDVPTSSNYAKQLALIAVGKTGVMYGGRLTAPVAHKWKNAWNENAKNLAFWNQYPEISHNEFVGWSSHPVDKSFAVFDLVSSFEDDRILKRFEVSDRLLSGLRPKSTTVNLQGNSAIAQQLWGFVLGDFVSAYLAILNGVNPMSLDLVDKMRSELYD